jgi:hypothetical protein
MHIPSITPGRGFVKPKVGQKGLRAWTACGKLVDAYSVTSGGGITCQACNDKLTQWVAETDAKLDAGLSIED